MSYITILKPSYFNDISRPRMPNIITGDNVDFSMTVEVLTPNVETLHDDGPTDDIIGTQAYLTTDRVLREDSDLDDDSNVIWLDDTIEVLIRSSEINWGETQTVLEEMLTPAREEDWLDEDLPENIVRLDEIEDIEDNHDTDAEAEAAWASLAIAKDKAEKVNAQNAIEEILSREMVGTKMRLEFRAGILVRFDFI